MENQEFAADRAQVLEIARALPAATHELLLADLAALDPTEVARLWRESGAAVGDQEPAIPEHSAARPDERERRRLARVGDALIASGKVAVLTVAGGEGTRLGFDAPKGCFPITPVRGASLYQLFAESIAATRARSGAELPWILVTSHATDSATRAHMREWAPWLGRDGEPGFETVVQGTYPVLDAEGRLVVAPDGRVAVAPDGHGGALRALARSGLLRDLRARGVEMLFYHQVDNPFGERPDPVLIGLHAESGAEATAKVVEKTNPDEKLGIVCRRGGRPVVVEYSELSATDMQAREPDGRLRFRAGSIAVHTFDLDFLARVAAEALPVHRAQKRVPRLELSGGVARPGVANAIKLETFIFDLLPRAKRFACLEVDRLSEFHPLKEASGEFSPDRVRRALSRWWAGWLLARGGTLPTGVAADGSTPVEISPHVARNADELPDHPQIAPDEQGRVLFS